MANIHMRTCGGSKWAIMVERGNRTVARIATDTISSTSKDRVCRKQMKATSCALHGDNQGENGEVVTPQTRRNCSRHETSVRVRFLGRKRNQQKPEQHGPKKRRDFRSRQTKLCSSPTLQGGGKTTSTNDHELYLQNCHNLCHRNAQDAQEVGKDFLHLW